MLLSPFIYQAGDVRLLTMDSNFKIGILISLCRSGNLISIAIIIGSEFRSFSCLVYDTDLARDPSGLIIPLRLLYTLMKVKWYRIPHRGDFIL